MTYQLTSTGKRARRSIPLVEETGTDTRTVGASTDKLPVELLAYIFEECAMQQRDIRPLSREMFRSHLRSVEAEYPPMLFLQICRRWREIALSTSSLWTSLSVGRMSWEHCGPSIAAMGYWLDRAGQAPLHLQLRSSGSQSSNARPSYANEMLDLFGKEISRWRSFSIEFDEELVGTMREILNRSQGTLTGLEELEICFQPEYWLVPVEPDLTFLSSILSLESLKRLYLSLNFPPMKSFPASNFQLIPWSQLNEILVQAPLSLEECVYYLSQCSTASRISLYATQLHSDPDPIPAHLPITTLPNLSSLVLDQYWDAVKALAFFNLPSLRHLTLSTSDIDGSNRRPFIFESFLERSHCAIDHLTIMDVSNKRSAVVDYFEIPALHTIPRVEFSFPRASSVMLELLRKHQDTSHIIPRLYAWGCYNGRTFIGWGLGWTLPGMTPEYKWEDGQIVFFHPDLGFNAPGADIDGLCWVFDLPLIALD
ncbi:hypothetical protein M413DRAFT_29274 [Hebeloma cylindrosporum]|uniref:Uncharacterized protein n=1 Tax=Hebeloma cylindrosporum TaxID=76867 RepID=A0A0C3C7J3_HEBCY|nr:hypothetical protein M413DRAFT_29274 [Hebeloma cylindrosporum h7]